MTRIQYIDRLKGLSMLAVIIGHISMHSFVISNSPIDLIVNTFHMPVFMFLSGVVISVIPNTKKTFIKLSQFLMPMLCIGLLFCFSFKKTVNDFFFDNVKSGYWYLFTLSIFYLLLSVFRIPSLLREKSDKSLLMWHIGLAVGVWVMIITLKFSLPVGYIKLFSIGQAFNYWPCFVSGFLLRKFERLEPVMGNNNIYSASLIGYIVLNVIFVNGFYHIYTLVGLCSIPVFIHLAKSRENSSTVIENALAYIGKNSLDIYIYHFFIIKILFLSEFGTWISKTGNYAIEGFCSLCLSIVIAYLCILIGKTIKKSQILELIVYGKLIQRFLK